MFLTGSNSIVVGSSEAFTLDKTELATLPTDPYFQDAGFWSQVLASYRHRGQRVPFEFASDAMTNAAAWTMVGSVAVEGNTFIMANSPAIEYGTYNVSGLEIGVQHKFKYNVLQYIDGSVVATAHKVSDDSVVASQAITATGAVELSFVASESDYYIKFEAAANSIQIASVQIVDISVESVPGGAQRVVLDFLDGNSAQLALSSKAKVGTWDLESVSIKDFDHGMYKLLPADIPNIALYSITTTLA